MNGAHRAMLLFRHQAFRGQGMAAGRTPDIAD
jgi:hypothetical protein